jgi:adenosylhomocysteine nucleosidase
VIGILAAVRQELNPVLRKMPSVDKESTGGILFYRGRIGSSPVVVARSGMGRARAEQAAQLMIERFQPVSILGIGFAGGLEKHVRPGELVLATEVYGAQRPDAALLESARQVQLANVRVHDGTLYCADHVVHSVAEKRQIAGQCPGALAIDMESAGIARAAERSEVPWMIVRGITDGLNDALPELLEPLHGESCIDLGTGDVIPLRMALLLTFRPGVIPQLIRLGGRASLAARNLADFVESYCRQQPK